MNDLIKEEIMQQAKRDIPNECCGFIIVDNNGKVARTYPAKNIAEDPNFAFAIDPQEYIEAEKKGKVIAYYHSHTLGDENFSDADKANSETLKLPLFVYSTLTDRFNFYTPSNYEAPLVGREFIWGVFDCWSLVVDYFKKLGVQLDNDCYFRKCVDDVIQNKFFEDEKQWEYQGFIKHNDKLKENDLILMRVNSKVTNHAAIYLDKEIILHHPGGRLSQRTFYGSYWKKCTHIKMRHKNLM